MLGRLRQGVKRVMEITVELVWEVCESVKINEKTKCIIIFGVGITLCAVSASRYKQAVELDTLRHLNKINELKGGV